MDQVQVQIPQPPGLVLCLCHDKSVLSSVIVVPEFRRHEDLLALDQAVGNCPSNALACLLFVLVVVCTVEETVSSLDSLVMAPEYQSRRLLKSVESGLLTL